MHIVQICNCANCANCAVVLGRVVVLVGEIIMMAKGMFAADPPHPSLPSTMQPMFRAQPNITSNAWSTPQQCRQCLQLSWTSHPTEHYIQCLEHNWTLHQTVEECSATWIEHCTQCVLHISGPMANDTTLNRHFMMSNDEQWTFQIVQLNTWHVDQLGPSDRRWWCAVNWRRWLPLQLITDYSYRQPNQTMSQYQTLLYHVPHDRVV